MIIFIAKGSATMGRTQYDKDGNIVKSTDAKFEVDANGPCIAIGEMDPDTMTIKEPISSVYGDWDAAGYLVEVMEMVKPIRPINIPNIKAMIQAAYADGVDLCDYCHSGCGNCQDCIVAEWKEEQDCKEQNNENE